MFNRATCYRPLLCIIKNSLPWAPYGSGRFLSGATENGWNDDGCGKNGVFPEDIIGLGFENVWKTREIGEWKIGRIFGV